MRTYVKKGQKLILDDLKAVYFSIPKTGCTSVKKFFSSYYDWKMAENVHDIKSEIFEHIFNKDVNTPEYEDYYKFAFVRDPFSRLYSAYKSKIKPGIEHPKYLDGVEKGLYNMGLRKEDPFARFVEIVSKAPDEKCDPHVKPQWLFITNNDGKLAVDELYRFEDFVSEFNKLIKKLNLDIDSCSVPHENRTQRNLDEYKEHYDRRLIDVVGERYVRDFDLLGYSRSF